MNSSNANPGCDALVGASVGSEPSAAFTPGPWRVTASDANEQPIVSASDYEVATCWHHCVESIEREAHANACLIAAAPDLLEALKQCAAWIVDLGDSGDAGFWDGEQAPEVLQARAAIAKALSASTASPAEASPCPGTNP